MPFAQPLGADTVRHCRITPWCRSRISGSK